MSVHTPTRQDKSFWLAAGVPAAFLLVMLYQGVLLTEGLIVTLSALPLTFIGASKGKQAFLLAKQSPTPTEEK